MKPFYPKMAARYNYGINILIKTKPTNALSKLI